MSIFVKKEKVRILQTLIFLLSIFSLGILYLLHHNTQQERKKALGEIEMLEAGNALVKASKYMTNEARIFSITGKPEHLKNYWEDRYFLVRKSCTGF